MRQTSAESREIDLMMRQWEPAKQRPVTTGEVTTFGWMSKSCSAVTRSCLFLLLAAGAGLAAAQDATAPLPTRTTLTVAKGTAAAAAGAETTGADTGRLATVLTAHVTDTTGRPIEEAGGAGTVSFETATASLGSVIVDRNGEASLPLWSLPPAREQAPLAVHAVYHPTPSTEGETAQAGSLSTEVLLQPDATGVPDFSVTANPATVTVKQGQSGTSVLTITPINGFNEQVTLSCSNLPVQVTCTFSPVIDSTANGAFASTLQIQTQAASGALAPPDLGIRHRSGSEPAIAFAWLLPGIAALAGFASLRRRTLARSALVTAVVLILAGSGLLGLSGCSSRYGYIHHPPSVATGTLVGTYTLNIAASGNDGSAVTIHNLSLTLQVQ